MEYSVQAGLKETRTTLKLPAKRLDPRLEIAHAAAIRNYQAQQSESVIDMLVGDDAPQFK